MAAWPRSVVVLQLLVGEPVAVSILQTGDRGQVTHIEAAHIG